MKSSSRFSISRRPQRTAITAKNLTGVCKFSRFSLNSHIAADEDLSIADVQVTAADEDEVQVSTADDHQTHSR